MNLGIGYILNAKRSKAKVTRLASVCLSARSDACITSSNFNDVH